MQEKQTFISKPPNSDAEEGGTLKFLEIQGVGPANQLAFQPGNRLSLITGDNGLGKTFLLDCAWWALTGKWAGLQAYPLSHYLFLNTKQLTNHDYYQNYHQTFHSTYFRS
ncbi:MAG: AAA family ATPase [Symploca sp. SIO2E6]|nr:AAA family ATPase [Symploca sp. SIO2E6]